MWLQKYKRILGAFILGTIFIPTSMVFAQDRIDPRPPAFGGSSFSWEITGKQLTARAGETLDNTLVFWVDNYSRGINIEDLRLDNIELACYGGDMVSSAYLKYGDRELSRSNFTRNGEFYIANLHGKELVIKNNSSYNFDIGLNIKSAVTEPQMVQCGVRSVVFYDLKNNREIYRGTESKDYTYVVANESTLITFGDIKPLNQPFVHFYSESDANKYLGIGTVRAKFSGIRNPALGEYLLEVEDFDKNFSGVPLGEERPLTFLFNIDPADAVALPKNIPIDIKVKDLELFGGPGREEADVKGSLTYVK